MTAPSASRSPVDSVVGDRLVRFDRAERWLHWSVGVLVMVMMTTGAVLYFGPLSSLVGRRVLMKDLHVYSGLLLPLPLLAVLARPWRAGVVRDAGRLSRWTRSDSAWVRNRGHDEGMDLGKFNAGQKLNSLLMAGVLPVLLLTGAIMRWFSPFPDHWRTGATFVHDLGAFAVWIAVTGHIVKAMGEPEAMRSMRSGWVPLAWARAHRPRWHAAAVAQEGAHDGEDAPADDGATPLSQA